MFTVFLADRDAAHRKELAHALRRRGLRTMEFTSGSDLYAGVVAAAPDLVLLDVDLDEMDGFQVFSRLLRWRAERPLPLVFLTEFANAHVMEVCIERGARAYLRKGDSPETVAAAVVDLLTTPAAAAPAGQADRVPPGPDENPDGGSPRGEPVGAPGRSRWAVLAACALVAALGFVVGALLAARSPQTSSPASPGSAPTAARGTSAADASRAAAPHVLGSLSAPGAGGTNSPATHPDSLTLPAVQSRTAVRAASRSLVGEVRIESAAAPALVHARPEPGRDPLGEVLGGRSLPLPDGAVLDAGGSDVRPAAERGHPRAARAPRVLRFRVRGTLEEVLRLYAGLGVEFERRVVRLQAPFPVVDRTLARGRLVLADGSEATLTVSEPGLDFAARDVYVGTSLRIDIRE
jgi:CheY-like chemotaxis protein